MLTLDKMSIEVKCPECEFYNEILLRQVRLRDMIICRGCKINLQLEDYMNAYRKAEREFRNVLESLESVLGREIVI